MMKTTDNSELFLNQEFEIDDIRFIADKTINNLVQEEKLLVFPHSLNANHKDLDGDKHIFSLHKNIKEDYVLTTNNIVGFIGRNISQLTISSRFSTNKGDFFLHYMLHKVFAINIFDLEHATDKDSIWDFLLYLFPYYLKQALNQGIFKEYQRRQYNDANLKGSIDVSRHIQINNPFMGKIAYHTREHSYDNSITQLIRHTIEYIRMHKFGSGILFNDIDTQSAVNQIIYATSTYEKNNRRNIINQNIRPLNHPYFTEYALLQKICLQILRQEGLTYGNEKDKVYGLLFDAAWLWEEYLNTILKEFRFNHPENKNRVKGIPLFKENRSLRFPDFYSEDRTIVLDAKYKRFENWDPNKENNFDIYQIITYLHCLNSIKGGLLFPVEESESLKCNKFEELGELHGYGGMLYKIGLLIPKKSNDFLDFIEQIKTNETDFVKIILKNHSRKVG